MKKIFTPVVAAFVNAKGGWFIAKNFIRLAEWFRYERSLQQRKKDETKLKIIFKDLVIADGYFRGIKYPEFSSFGSSLFPKLSGSYESELFPYLKKIKNNHYENIIDVGCAEGYYAAGLAVKYPDSIVHAYDTDANARLLCKKMADANNVADRVIIYDKCTPGILKKLNPSCRNLIIADCEGFERELFNSDNIRSLQNTDLIIELHPMFNSDVKKYIEDLFVNSHYPAIITSHDDERKIFDLNNEYSLLSLSEKRMLVQEGRAFTMDWIVLTPKLHYARQT